MKKFILLFCVLFVSTQQVFASNNILEEKYKELADLVDKDINFVKESVSKIESNLTELQIVQQLIDAFWSNKYCKTTDYYNCSQLVWCAYKQTSNIDLDSNLGLLITLFIVLIFPLLLYAINILCKLYPR